MLAVVRGALGEGPWQVALRIGEEDLGPAAEASLVPPETIRPGRNFFQIRIPSGEKTIQRVLAVDVTRSDSVWVTTQAFPPGWVLGDGDVRRVLRRHAHAAEEIQVENPVGLRLHTGLASDRILVRANLETPPLVHRGDRVRLFYESEALEVATLAEAREEGRPGDVIRLRALGSRKECRGLVRADGAVEVVLP